jgi:hypothetical protein
MKKAERVKQNFCKQKTERERIGHYQIYNARFNR